MRRCWAMIKWQDVGDGRYCFELTKAGLVVRQKCHRKLSAVTIPFDRLTEGGGWVWKDGGVPVRFAIGSRGVEVRRGASKAAFLVDFATLSNISRPQPELPL